jgi:leishmanolysin-like peptidase
VRPSSSNDDFWQAYWILLYFLINSPFCFAFVTAAIHEVGHVLGISGSLIKYYRTPDGTPRTPRPFQSAIVECVDGSWAEMELPDESYLVLGKTNRGLLHYTLTTPRAQQAARNHFNCVSVTGIRLENQPTGVGDCVGTHLDERLFFTELMGPLISPNSQTVFSALTLAWLEDSGWYRVYYGGVKNSPYGLGAGCAFVDEDCIQDNLVPDFGLGDFCNGLIRFDDSGFIDGQLNEMFCDPSHVSWAYCDLFDTGDLPANFLVTFPVDSTRYFPDFPNVSAATPQSDWCPMPIIPVGIDCTDSDTLQYTFSGTYDGEQYGPGNRCINAEFTFTSGSTNAQRRPACLSVECNANTTTVTVDGQLCEYDGQRLSIALSAAYSEYGSGIFTCPKVTTICPHFFCEGGCSARGVCNYDAQPPRCECDDPNDTSEQCSGAFGTRAPFTVAPSPVPQPTSDRRPFTAATSSGARGVAGWTRSVLPVVLFTWVVSGCSGS